MATTFSNISSSTKINWTESETREGEDLTVSPSYTPGRTYTSGTAANQIDKIKKDISISITSGNTTSFDLYDLANFASTNDVLGNTLTSLAEIVELYIANSSLSAGNAIVGGNGTAAAWNSLFNASDTAEIILYPSAFLHVGCPAATAWAVADSSNHLLDIEANGGNITIDIIIFGRSA